MSTKPEPHPPDEERRLPEVRIQMLEFRVEQGLELQRKTAEALDKLNGNMITLVKLSERQTVLADRHQELDADLRLLRTEHQTYSKACTDDRNTYKSDRNGIILAIRVATVLIALLQGAVGFLIYGQYNDIQVVTKEFPLLKQRVEDIRLTFPQPTTKP